VEALDRQGAFEQEMQTAFTATPEIALLMTLPGVGFTLAVVLALEVGDVSRLARRDKLAAYAGTTPHVHASGGKTRLGPLRPDVNRCFEVGLVEAANMICRHRRGHPRRHTSQLYDRIARRTGHAKASGAVARHLAEATSWVLSKRQSYRDPALTVTLRLGPTSSTAASARVATERPPLD